MLTERKKKRIKRVFSRKARFLGLRLKRLDVTEKRKGPLEGIVEIDAKLFVAYQDGNVSIKAVDISGFSHSELEAALEHEACHCKDEEEGIYGKEYCGPSDKMDRAMSVEMLLAYTEHFVAKRQIAAFGMERFADFHMKDMKDFVRTTEGNIKGSYDPAQKKLFIFAYFKEQVKSNLMDDTSGLLPPVIKEIAAPFAGCFEELNRAELDWVRKSVVLYMMVAYINVNLHLIESHQKGIIVPNPQQFGVSRRFAEKGLIDSATFTACSRVEDLMNASYNL